MSLRTGCNEKYVVRLANLTSNSNVFSYSFGTFKIWILNYNIFF